jgi:hypothetical protein
MRTTRSGGIETSSPCPRRPLDALKPGGGGAISYGVYQIGEV